MAKISLLVPDAFLEEIDAQAEGNRSSFMVTAALERARRLRRDRIDAEIAASLSADADLDAKMLHAWEATTADGLE